MQSRFMSFVEVATSSLIGFVVSLFVNWVTLPMFGMPRSFGSSFWITVIFMVISIARAYVVRRFFAVYLGRFYAWCQSLVSRFDMRLYRYWGSLRRQPWQAPQRRSIAELNKSDFWPTFYTTPSDWKKCQNLRTDGPTPCWHPHCDCMEKV